MKMVDQQLSLIIRLLNENKIHYWLDNGTLLGIYREGKVLEHDTDIDISAWNIEEDKIIQLSKYLLNDYSLRVLNYGGYNFKYKFTHKNKDKVLPIDISLFIQKGDNALCPQPILRKNLLSRGIWKFYKKWYWKRKVIKFDTVCYKILFKMYTWEIPIKYIENTITKDNFIFPTDTDKYLEFRYGNWRIPQKKWSSVNDDKGISKIDINNL